MPRKEKSKYKGTPNDEVYVVWIDGEWAIYKELSRASVQFSNAQNARKPAQILRYQVTEVIGDYTPGK